MTQARNTLVSTADTPYYHCVSRCVRRAYLCGYDRHSQIDYEHRRQWLENKLHEAANVFSIKLCTYAVMSNHYHVVVHIRSGCASKWSKREVIRRWHALFKGTYLSQCFESGDLLLPAQIEVLYKDVEIWRERLSSLSQFMKVVNESIARRANIEDNCTGHFWESRFKSQALLDKRALLSCMSVEDFGFETMQAFQDLVAYLRKQKESYDYYVDKTPPKSEQIIAQAPDKETREALGVLNYDLAMGGA